MGRLALQTAPQAPPWPALQREAACAQRHPQGLFSAERTSPTTEKQVSALSQFHSQGDLQSTSQACPGSKGPLPSRLLLLAFQTVAFRYFPTFVFRLFSLQGFCWLSDWLRAQALGGGLPGRQDRTRRPYRGEERTPRGGSQTREPSTVQRPNHRRQPKGPTFRE